MMGRPGSGPFRYHVGVGSLAEVATREDRVCVLNILGGESRDVTPVGHAYSGGNVVFGTSPGRGGQVLETPAGPVPVFNNVREGLDAGHHFNCGVIYLPPAAARDGVAELIRINPDLRKIFIVTEKMSVRDSREIRAMAQAGGVDVFGGNSLGVADSWSAVRIGGALGGDIPAESLRKGSIAILSNSGNFTTTIAIYLRMGGWGTTTLISSGKDVYIQFAAPEFALALANDDRSRAAALYVEPGGFYERDADFTKPVVACVVGRWKARLTRAVGHAGAIAGGHDDAAAKERWFMEKFGVAGLFTPETQVVSQAGAVVNNIAHIPAALTAVMAANGIEPDFEPEGSLALKPWFGSSGGLTLPAHLDLPPVEAPAPYDRQIAALARQIGRVFPRAAMKDASSASSMDPATQVSTLHGVPMLEAARQGLEANLCLSLLRTPGRPCDHAITAVAVASAIPLHDAPTLAAAEAARLAGNAPNAVLAAAVCLAGPLRAEGARVATALLIDRFAAAGLRDAYSGPDSFDLAGIRFDPAEEVCLRRPERDAAAEAMLAALTARDVDSVFLRLIRRGGAHPSADGVRAAMAATLAWEPLMQKRISRLTAEALPWWLQLFGLLLGASAPAAAHAPGAFQGLPEASLLGTTSLTEIAFLALFGRRASADDLFAFQTLLGLMLTNGPGTISAQGAKGAVSADGPETPGRVQLNKALAGFLTHTGYTHGGNGYEGIAFLLAEFAGTGLSDPGDPGHGLDIPALASACANRFAVAKASVRAAGGLDGARVPGVNHPVFKGEAVNHDPREVFIHDLFSARGSYNVFHEFYRELVVALHASGAARNVYCVNIDAVIAALLLKMLWKPLQAGLVDRGALEAAAFTVFLYARMLGCAAEIDDHMNRGRNMDTRTEASRCRHIV